MQAMGADSVETLFYYSCHGPYERRVVLKHALRPRMTPVITRGALEFGTLLRARCDRGRFHQLGFGRLIVPRGPVLNRDYAVVRALCWLRQDYIVLNLVADVAHAGQSEAAR